MNLIKRRIIEAIALVTIGIIFLIIIALLETVFSYTQTIIDLAISGPIGVFISSFLIVIGYCVYRDRAKFDEKIVNEETEKKDDEAMRSL